MTRRSLRESSRFPLERLGEAEIPRIILGTSPFIGAGQFGLRAMYYFKKFYLNPRNIVDLVRKSIEMGCPGVQAVAYERIIDSLILASEEANSELAVLAVVGVENLEKELELLEVFDNVAVALHASLGDKIGEDRVERALEIVRESFGSAGISTHSPTITLERISRERSDIEFVLVPINPIGYMMGDPERTLELVEELRKNGTKIVAIKPLAAGKLKPSEALPFVLRRADVVAVGLTSEDEMRETYSIALRELEGRKRS